MINNETTFGWGGLYRFLEKYVDFVENIVLQRRKDNTAHPVSEL